MTIVRPEVYQSALELVDQSEATFDTVLTNERSVLPVVLCLTEPVHQDDHQGRGGDLEAGQGGKDGLQIIIFLFRYS